MIANRYRSVLLQIIAGILLITGCDAPRSNPFDPQSSAYIPASAPSAINDLAVSEITSTTALLSWTAPAGAVEYLTYHSLPGWDGRSNQNAILYTGVIPGVGIAGSRQSVIIDLPSEESRSWAIFSRSENGLVSAGSNPVTIVPLRRNRLGNISAKATSIFQSSWIPPDLIELSLTAAISDSDGVDSVWATSDLGDFGELLLTRDGVTWSTQIAEHQAPTGILERLIGHAITVHYIDRSGFTSQSSPIYLSRIIYTPPLIESPRDTVVSEHPRLTWLAYGSEFIFTYGVDVVFIDTLSYNQTPIYRKYGINSDSTGHTVEDSLYARQGFYIWTLSVEDEFGDQAYSTEFKFSVSNGE